MASAPTKRVGRRSFAVCFSAMTRGLGARAVIGHRFLRDFRFALAPGDGAVSLPAPRPKAVGTSAIAALLDGIGIVAAIGIGAMPGVGRRLAALPRGGAAASAAAPARIRARAAIRVGAMGRRLAIGALARGRALGPAARAAAVELGIGVGPGVAVGPLVADAGAV